MSKNIELIKVDQNMLGHELVCYRTLETKQYDEFGNPKDIFDYEEKYPSSRWKSTGNEEVEKAIVKLLFLESKLGFFVGVPKEIFMKWAPVSDLKKVLKKKKIRSVNYEKEGELIMHSENSLNILWEKELEHSVGVMMLHLSYVLKKGY